MSVNNISSNNNFGYDLNIELKGDPKTIEKDMGYVVSQKGICSEEIKEQPVLDPDFMKFMEEIEDDSLLTEKEIYQYQELYKNFKMLNPPMRDDEVQLQCEDLVKSQRKIYDHFVRFSSMQLPRGGATDGKNVAYVHAKTKGGAKEIGKGSFNQAFLGYRLDFQTGNVIEVVHRKLKNSKYFEATQKELELQKKFQSHPNIVQVYDYIPYKTRKQGKVTAYLERCSFDLEKTIRGKKPLNFQQKLTALIEITSALTYIHSEGYCHNDLKADNILIDQNNKAKLTDFGASCKIGEKPAAFFKKILAPEQTAKQEIVTDKTDIYQCGYLIYTLFHPDLDPKFLEKTINYPSKEVLFNNWPVLSKNDQMIQKLILSCLSEDPKNRPSSAEVGNILKQLISNSCIIS